MLPATSTAPTGAVPPTVIAAPAAAGLRECALLNRVGRVLQDLSAARVLTDAEVRQHAQDCALLMEQAYGRFEESHNPHDRDEAVLWMHRRDEALRSLSPAWKAAREAEIQRQIDEGCGYFVEQGDAARARSGGVEVA